MWVLGNSLIHPLSLMITLNWFTSMVTRVHMPWAPTIHWQFTLSVHVIQWCPGLSSNRVQMIVMSECCGNIHLLVQLTHIWHLTAVRPLTHKQVSLIWRHHNFDEIFDVLGEVFNLQPLQSESYYEVEALSRKIYQINICKPVIGSNNCTSNSGHSLFVST